MAKAPASHKARKTPLKQQRKPRPVRPATPAPNPPQQPETANPTGQTPVSGGVDLSEVLGGATVPGVPPPLPPVPEPSGLRADQLAGGVRVVVGFVARLAGLPVELDEDESETLAEALIPVMDKYLPSVAGNFSAEINLALVASVIIGGAASRAKRNRGSAGAERNGQDN